MAKFELELPTEVMKDVQFIYDNTENIFGAMTRAGADVVEVNMRNNAPDMIRNFIKKTRTYRTPSDDGINTKVYASGYIPFSDPNRKSFSRKGGNGKTYTSTEGVPVDFLANLYEYGRSTPSFPKHPFLRKSFNKKQIEDAMLSAQSAESRGLLDDK